MQPRTGWVVSAAHQVLAACGGSGKSKSKDEESDLLLLEQFCTTLSKQESVLRGTNVAVWRACELHAFKTRGAEWM